jgi:hypothetical protein
MEQGPSWENRTQLAINFPTCYLMRKLIISFRWARCWTPLTAASVEAQFHCNNIGYEALSAVPMKSSKK